MTSVPIYLAITRFDGDGEPGGVTVTGTHETTAALGVTSVPLRRGLTRWETRLAVAAVLHDNGWRVAGKWDDCLGDVSWAVAVERVITCLHCGTEIWWRIPQRLAGVSGILGGWCDASLDDICAGTTERAHEPRHSERE